MLLSKPIEIPLIAVPISVTATMPMITPSAVSVERVMFDRICAQAIRQLSLQFVKEAFHCQLTRDCGVELGNDSARRSLSIKPSRKMNRAARVRGDVAFVGHQNDRVAPLIKIFEQRHDFVAGLGIEIPGRFVRQNDRWLVDQSARDRDALALTAGQFVRLMMDPIAQANVDQRLFGALLARFRIDAGINQRQFDIS